MLKVRCNLCVGDINCSCWLNTIIKAKRLDGLEGSRITFNIWSVLINFIGGNASVNVVDVSTRVRANGREIPDRCWLIRRLLFGFSLMRQLGPYVRTGRLGGPCLHCYRVRSLHDIRHHFVTDCPHFGITYWQPVCWRYEVNLLFDRQRSAEYEELVYCVLVV